LDVRFPFQNYAGILVKGTKSTLTDIRNPEEPVICGMDFLFSETSKMIY